MAKVALNFATPYILNGEFFEIISQEGESVTVRCCYCEGSRNIYKGSVKSTGNFHMHIKRKHPGLVTKVHASKLRAYLARKALQLQRKPALKRKYFKTEMEAESQILEAINLKTHPTSQASGKTNTVQIKHELPSNNERRQVRNIFAHPLNEGSPSDDIPLHQPRFNDSPSNQSQSEPTNLSQHEFRVQIENYLPRIENALRSIEREMRLRNQIESNRLVLELAKFRYVNPDFHFRF